jgi:hypothetical protein
MLAFMTIRLWCSVGVVVGWVANVSGTPWEQEDEVSRWQPCDYRHRVNGRSRFLWNVVSSAQWHAVQRLRSGISIDCDMYGVCAPLVWDCDRGLVGRDIHSLWIMYEVSSWGSGGNTKRLKLELGRGGGGSSLIRLHTAIVFSVENCFELSNEF